MDAKLVAVLKKYSGNLKTLGVTVEGLIVYGSQADGSFQEESDIDLLVVSPSFASMDLWERQSVLGRARVGIPFAMDVRGATRRELERAEPGQFLRDEILAKGIAIPA